MELSAARNVNAFECNDVECVWMRLNAKDVNAAVVECIRMCEPGVNQVYALECGLAECNMNAIEYIS